MKTLSLFSPGGKARLLALVAAAVLLAALTGCPAKDGGERRGGEGAAQVPAAFSGHSPPPALMEAASPFPAGALVFLYSPDLSDLLEKVETSSSLKVYLDSQGHARFKDSRLFRKLTTRFEELAGLASDEARFGDLAGLAGKESALALYDIGEVKFVYSSRAPMEKISRAMLWGARDKAEEIGLEGETYYALVSSGGPGALYFGVREESLVVSNDEDLFQSVFSALGGGEAQTPKLSESDPFKSAFPKDLEAGDLVMYLDQEALNQDWYFKHYWIYQNLEDISWIKSAAVDLEIGDLLWRERRFIAGEGPPDRYVNRDLSMRDALAPLGDVLECVGSPGDNEAAMLALGNLFTASELGEALKGGDAGEGKARTLAEWIGRLGEILHPAGPVAAGSVSGLEWTEGRVFWRRRGSVVLELAHPGELDLAGLRREWAANWSKILFGASSHQLEWKKGQEGTALSMPFLKDMEILIDADGPYLIVSNDARMHVEVKKALLAPAGTSRDPFSGAYYSRWDMNEAGHSVRLAFDALDRYGDWPRMESKNALLDLRSLLDAMGPGVATREVLAGDDLLEERVTFKGEIPG